MLVSSMSHFLTSLLDIMEDAVMVRKCNINNSTYSDISDHGNDKIKYVSILMSWLCNLLGQIKGLDL